MRVQLLPFTTTKVSVFRFAALPISGEPLALQRQIDNMTTIHFVFFILAFGFQASEQPAGDNMKLRGVSLTISRVRLS